MKVGYEEHTDEETFDNRKRHIEQEKRAERLKQTKEEKERKKSPFNNFIQLNDKKMAILRHCSTDNPKALSVLLFILEYMDNYNAVVCSYQVLQEALDFSQATVARSIKYLKDKNLIYVKKTGTANVYIVNPELVWRSWGNNKKYCQFPANVLLAESEQEAIKISYTKNKELEIKKEK